MYGLVLMAAMTTAPDTTAFGWRTGCSGCTGLVVGGCTGSYVSASCYGNSCVGSCHGGLFPRLRAHLSGLFGGCHGSSCYSSACYGSSCLGSSCLGSACYGSSCLGSCSGVPGVYGLTGSQAGWAAHGVYYADPGAIPYGHPVTITPGPGSGCFGDSYLNYSCYGSPIFVNRSGMLTGPTHYGTPIYSPTSFGHGSCFGSGPVYYGPDFHPTYYPGVGTGVTPPQVRIDKSEHELTRAKPQSGPARLTVELPADATLYVDGVLTKGEGNTRNFHTPDLPAGQTFYYELKAEVTVDGKTLTDSKRVLIKAGAVLNEGFPQLIAAAKADADRNALVRK